MPAHPPCPGRVGGRRDAVGIVSATRTKNGVLQMASERSSSCEQRLQQAASEARALRQVEALIAACCRLELDPRDEDARGVVASIGSGLLAICTDECLLRQRLVQEVIAHASDLGRRFESGLDDALVIRSSALRLSQASASLRVQFDPTGSANASSDERARAAADRYESSTSL